MTRKLIRYRPGVEREELTAVTSRLKTVVRRSGH